MNPLIAPTLIICSTALLIAGAYHHHDQTGFFLSGCGILIGIFGLVISIKHTDRENS